MVLGTWIKYQTNGSWYYDKAFLFEQCNSFILVDALIPGMRREATRHSARSRWRLLSDLTQFISFSCFSFQHIRLLSELKCRICTVYYVLFLLGVLYHKAGCQEESEQIILGFVKLTNYPIDKLPKRCVNPIQEVVHKTLNSSAT